MRHILQRRATKTQKIISGLLVALIVFAAPLPAFADSSPATPAATSAEQGATTTPSPSPAPTPTPAPAPSASSTPTPTPAPAAPTVDTPVLGLSVTPASTPSVSLPASQPAASAPSSTTTISGQNQITSTATSGDASVTGNKKAGDATSGSAQANATVVNVANSATNFGTGTNFTYFTQDITGDQNHDITIDPATFLQGGSTASSSTSDLQTAVSLTDILNNIALSANSGNATVSDNKKAGDATSGDASALANVINIVGSSITAQQSFLGVINIYGNLKGNILVPQSLVDGLIQSSGTGSGATGTTNTTIENTIDASAHSGNATVSDNKKAGDATSGDASTSLTVYNLTGQQVVAKNSLLVFVNVLGKWVGMIVKAPTDSHTALFGKDASSDTADQTQVAPDTDSTTHITNNISVSATSGDATVSGNKKTGDATSGTASAGVNLLNITNSNFKLGDWFGALFINVLGSWLGDFGIQDDTATTTTGDGSTPTNPEQPIKDVRIFQFQSEAPVTPLNSVSAGSSANRTNQRDVTLTAATTDDKSGGTVLGASTTDSNTHGSDGAHHSISIDMVALVAIVGALTLLIALGSLIVRRQFVTA